MKPPGWRPWARPLAAAALLTPAALIVIYFGCLAIVALSQGYRWAEMDWNSDGVTSIAEFFESSDIGRRPMLLNGRDCIEYFAFKDGLTVRLDCR